MTEGHSPLEQFEIKHWIEMSIGGVDVSFTNSAGWMIVATVLITALLTLSMRGRAMVPGRMQSIAELAYEFVAGMLTDNAGTGGRQFFPFIFTLFMFILFSNLLGMVPYSFTTTSHIIVTFSLAAVVFIGVTIVGFVKNGLGFLRLFVPSGVPLYLLVVLVPIEIISYFVRPFSLSIRLFANMMAGHTMLKVFGGFVVGLGFYLGWAPFVFIIILSGLEIGIAILQAYVFAVLSCLYLNDALHPGH